MTETFHTNQEARESVRGSTDRRVLLHWHNPFSDDYFYTVPAVADWRKGVARDVLWNRSWRYEVIDIIEPAPSQGGLDGVVVSFGDGADVDTWYKLFGAIAAAEYVVQVTHTTAVKGELAQVDVELADWGWDANNTAFELHGFLHRPGKPVPFAVDIAEIQKLHIY